MDRSIPLSLYNLHYQYNNVTLRRLCPPRSERITHYFNKRDSSISSRRSSKSRVVSRIFRFSFSRGSREAPSRRFSSQIFQLDGRGEVKLMFRLLDTLPRFFYSSSHRVNLSTDGCCSRRIIANSFYSPATVHGKQRHPLDDYSTQAS